MRSAENNCGRTLEDASAVHWKSLTPSSRGGNSNRCESLVAALQTHVTTVFTPINSKMKSLFQLLFRAAMRESMANSELLPDAPKGTVPPPVAFGELPARESAIANSLDPEDAIDFSENADGWFKISPYGVFRGKNPARPQHITPESGRAMESEFNSVVGRLGRLFRGIPIYHGHPDVNPELWPDDRRIGKVTQLQSRADGLWGFAEWNSLGEENKKQGWWIYPSPRWDMAAGKTRFEPDRLISIGLTNTPRIAESDPVFNSMQPGCKANKTEETNTTTETMDPKIIRQKLGLPPEATDEEVMAKIDSLNTTVGTNATAVTDLAAVKAEKEEMENSIRAKDAEIIRLRDEQNNSILGDALATGRITAADRPAWEAKLKSDKRAEEINALRSLNPAKKTQALNLGDRRTDRAGSDTLREEVHNSVAKLQKDEGLTFGQAWAKTKANKKFAAYFGREEG